LLGGTAANKGYCRYCKWLLVSNIVNTIEFMTASTNRKVGRPPSGRKAYCLRLKQQNYALLLRKAKNDGFSSVAGWLDHFASTIESEPAVVRMVRGLKTKSDL
jgi:hypothetical protein